MFDTQKIKIKVFIEHNLRIRKLILNCYSYRVLDVQKRVSKTAIYIIEIAIKNFPKLQIRSLEKRIYNFLNILKTDIDSLIKN